MPFGGEPVDFYVRETINSVDKMAITEDKKGKYLKRTRDNFFTYPWRYEIKPQLML